MAENSRAVLPVIDWNHVDRLIELAFAEDLGAAGDVTTNSIIPCDTVITARMRAKSECVCACLELAERIFKRLDPDCEWTNKVSDGTLCQPGTVMAEVRGKARAILTAERTALNFIQRLAGIATMSRKYASAVAVPGSRTVVLDTRKTTPGFRNLEKYAVAVGGASNHRIGLYDRVMMKDNHLAIAGIEGKDAILRGVAKARAAYPGLEIEVEIDSLDQLDEALASGAEYILLDNMDNEKITEAVKRTAGRAKLEASGNITIERLPSLAATGVDFASSGALTHSVKAADISLDIDF